MAHVALYKKKIVSDLTKLFRSYPIIGCLDMENLPAPQLQQMKANLRGRVVTTMTKRRLIKIAIDQCKDVKGIEKIKDYLLGMPALLFTKEDPFKLNKILQKSKTNAPAKAGQIAPKDIVINAGPTSFSPGPIIGELAQIGLKTGVEANKVVIKEDRVVVKKGEPIKPEVASILTRLDIKPMEIGLNLVAILEDGEIIPKEILIVSEEEYIQKLQQAHNYAFNLSIEAGIIIKDNVEFLISKAFNQAKALALEGNIMSDVVVKEMLSSAEKTALQIKEEGKIETEEKEEIVEEEKEEKKKEQKEEIVEEEKEEKKSEEKKEKKEEKKEEEKSEEKKEQKEEIKEEKIEREKNQKEETNYIKKDEGFSKDVDANVMSMIRKTKDFMKGKITADDVLKS